MLNQQSMIFTILPIPHKSNLRLISPYEICADVKLFSGFPGLIPANSKLVL